MAQFQIGEVVQLNSGGSLMTIASCFDESETNEPRIQLFNSMKELYPEESCFYMCIWFNEKNELKQDIFQESILTNGAKE